MNRDFILPINFFEKLNDDELLLLIDMIPKDILLDHIKRRHKKFKNETRGLRLDLKSSMLHKRMPRIYFNYIKKQDESVIIFIKGCIEFCIKEIWAHIIKRTDDKFLDKAVSGSDINDFSKLLDILSEVIESKYIKLFFKIIDKQLNEEQIKHIDIHMEVLSIRKELEEEISRKYREQSEREITKYIQEINGIKDQLNITKKELVTAKQNSELLKAKIKNIESKKSHQIDALHKEIRNLKNSLQKVEEEKVVLKSDIREKEERIEKLKQELNIRYEEYSTKAQEKWNLENKRLLEIQERLKAECKELDKTKRQLSENIQILKSKHQQMEDKLSEYRKVVSSFIENIDRNLIEKALNDSLLKYSSSNYKVSSNLYVKSNKLASDIEECSSIHDFAENIAVNLENIGVRKVADDLANYIIGILATGLTPLICGFRAREIATAISSSYSGETPYIISLPNGFTDSKRLIEIYQSVESNVILIEDAVGTMNENALMPLLRDKAQRGFSPKLLLLATENIDSVKYMPFNLYNQVALVMVDEYTLRRDDYQFSDARKVFKDFISYDSFDEDYKETSSLIRKLLNKLELGSPYEMLRSAITAYSKHLSNTKSALEEYLRSELMFICQSNNTISYLEQNIQRYQLGDSLDEIVRGGMYG